MAKRDCNHRKGNVSFGPRLGTAPDTDFTAKLVDVHPDGFAHNVVDRIARARYRKGSKLPPELRKADVGVHYDLDLGYTATMLRPGHRLRLEISSSNFPHYERNLNTGASNQDTTETRVAHNTILQLVSIRLIWSFRS